MAPAPDTPKIPRNPNSSIPSTCHVPEISCRGAGADFWPSTGGVTGRPQKSTPGSSVWPSTGADAQLNRLASPWQIGGDPFALSFCFAGGRVGGAEKVATTKPETL